MCGEQHIIRADKILRVRITPARAGITSHVNATLHHVNELRQRQYDCLFLAVDPNDRESLHLLQHLRSFDKTTELVVITSERSARDMAGDKSRLDIAAFLHTPIDVTQFFRLVGRLRARTVEDPRKSSAGLKTVPS